jgi:hypothetical protein
MNGMLRFLTPFFLLLMVLPAQAEDISRDTIKGLDEQVQDIKKDVIDLTAELGLLEEKLLFPSNTQVSLFVSMNKDDDFRLDALQIKLDNKVVVHYLYTYRELEALQKGGVQRVYTGNIKTGDHDMVVSLMGKAPAGGEYRRSASYTVKKEIGPRFVEINISGPGGSDTAIGFKDW